MRNHGRRRGRSSSSNSNDPLRVLGIALIVDEKGIGARLVARYPTQPVGDANEEDEVLQQEDDVKKQTTMEPDDTNTADENNTEEDNLFFTLTSRQMAKLFRTKKALCNQPMTLRVNRTIFCCHAVLMDTENSDNTAATPDNEKEPHLTLFSVVVALSAPAREAVVPFGNFWDGANSDNNQPMSVENVATALPTTHDDQMDLERYLRHVTKEGDKKKSDQT